MHNVFWSEEIVNMAELFSDRENWENKVLMPHYQIWWKGIFQYNRIIPVTIKIMKTN